MTSHMRPASVMQQQPLGGYGGGLRKRGSNTRFDPLPQSSTTDLLPSLIDDCESEGDTTTSNDSANLYHFQGIEGSAHISHPLSSSRSPMQPSIGNGAFRRYSGGRSRQKPAVNPVVWSLPEQYYGKRSAIPSAPIPSPMYVHGDHGMGAPVEARRRRRSKPQRPLSPVPFASYGDVQPQQQQQQQRSRSGGESFEMYNNPCRYAAPSLLDTDSTTTATSVSSLSSGSARRMTSTIKEQMVRHLANKKREEEELNRKRTEAAAKLRALPELKTEGDDDDNDDDDDDESDAKSSVDQLAHFLTAPAAALKNPAARSEPSPPPSAPSKQYQPSTSPVQRMRDGQGKSERAKQAQSLMQIVADSHDEGDGVLQFQEDEEEEEEYCDLDDYDDDGEEIWEFDQYDGRHLQEEEEMLETRHQAVGRDREPSSTVPLNAEVRELLREYLDGESVSDGDEGQTMQQQQQSFSDDEVDDACYDEGLNEKRSSNGITESCCDADGEYEHDESASALSLTVDGNELEGELQPNPNNGKTPVLASMVSVDGSAMSAPTDEDMSEPDTDLSFLAHDVIDENTEDDEHVTERESTSGGIDNVDDNQDGNYLSHLTDGIARNAAEAEEFDEDHEDEQQPSDMVSLEWSVSDITTSIASVAPSRDTLAASLPLADDGEGKEDVSFCEHHNGTSPGRNGLDTSRESQETMQTKHATSLPTFAYREFPRGRRRRLSAGKRNSRRDSSIDHLGSLTSIPADEDVGDDGAEDRRLEPIVELEEEKKVLKVRWVPSLIRLYQYKLTKETTGSSSSISSKSFVGSSASGLATPPESSRQPHPDDSEQLVNALHRSMPAIATPISSLDGSRNAKQTKRKTLSPRSVLDPTIGVVDNERRNRDLQTVYSETLQCEENNPSEEASPPRHYGDGKEPPYLEDFVEAALKVSLFDCKLPGAGQLCLLQNLEFGDEVVSPSALVQRALEESLREDDEEPNRRNRVRRLRDSISRRSAIREEAGLKSQHWPSVDTDYSMDALFESYASARQLILDDKPIEALAIFEKLLRLCEDCDQEVHDDAFVYKLVGAVMHNIAVIHMRSDTFDKCVDLWDETILTLRDSNPSEGVYTSHVATALTELGISHFASKKYHKAIKAFADVLHIWQEIRGVENDSITTAVNNIGVTYFALGAPFEALDAFDEALEVHRGILTGRDQQGSPLFSERVNVSNGLRSKRVRTSSDGSVLSLRGSAVEAGKTLVGVAKTLCNIACVYRHLGEDEDALGLLEEALQIQEAVRGNEDLHTETTRMMMEAIRTSLSQEGRTSVGDHSDVTESEVNESFDGELIDMQGASNQPRESFWRHDSMRKLHSEGLDGHGRRSPSSPSRISEFSRRLSESLAPTVYSSTDTSEAIRRRALMSMCLSDEGDP